MTRRESCVAARRMHEVFEEIIVQVVDSVERIHVAGHPDRTMTQ